MIAHGFPLSEFEARTSLAQSHMAKHGLGALLLTAEPEIRYFTGYLTRFLSPRTGPEMPQT